jgi:hypothetical protein
MSGASYKDTAMKAPGDIGWKKYHKLMSNPARLASYKRRREPRYSHRVFTLSENITPGCKVPRPTQRD